MVIYNKIRLFLTVLIIGSVTCLAAVLVRNLSTTRIQATPSNLPRNVTQSLEKIHYHDIRDGKRPWDLHAEQVAYDTSGDVAHLKTVLLTTPRYDKFGTITMKADDADYFTKSGNVSLRGNITATSSTDLTFSAITANFDAARSLITSQDRVRLVNPQFTVEGTGLELSLTTRNVRIIHNVVAHILPKNAH